MEWNGMEWNGMEWSEMKWGGAGGRAGGGLFTFYNVIGTRICAGPIPNA